MKKHLALWLAALLCALALAAFADGDTRAVSVDQLVFDVPTTSIVMDPDDSEGAQGVLLGEGIILTAWRTDTSLAELSPFMRQMTIYLTPNTPEFAIEHRELLTIGGCRSALMRIRYPERPDGVAHMYILPTDMGTYTMMFYVFDEMAEIARPMIDAVLASARFDQNLPIATVPPVIATPAPTRVAMSIEDFFATVVPTIAPMLTQSPTPITLETGNYVVGAAIAEGTYRLSLAPGVLSGGAICQNPDGKWQGKMQSMFGDGAAIERFEITNGQLLNVVGTVVFSPAEDAI